MWEEVNHREGDGYLSASSKLFTEEELWVKQSVVRCHWTQYHQESAYPCHPRNYGEDNGIIRTQISNFIQKIYDPNGFINYSDYNWNSWTPNPANFHGADSAFGAIAALQSFPPLQPLRWIQWASGMKKLVLAWRRHNHGSTHSTAARVTAQNQEKYRCFHSGLLMLFWGGEICNNNSHMWNFFIQTVLLLWQFQPRRARRA